MPRGDGYDLWRNERVALTPEDRRADRPTNPAHMLGFWRIVGAKTKPDYAVSIWARSPADEVVIFQIGRKKMATDENPVEWEEFTAGGWLDCVPVTKDDWSIALDTGLWPDGKPARKLTDDEKAGIAAGSGGNNPPRDEALADQIKNLAETIEATAEPKTQDEANDLSGLLDRMRSLLKLAEAERVKEKEPHLQAGRDVDARWKEITGPGSVAYDEAEKRRKAFLRKEQSRLDAIAAEETRKRQEEARAEQERIRREAEEAARKEAEAAGMSEAEIDRHVAETEPDVPEIAVAPVEPERATAGSAYGASRGLKKVKRGRIDDAKVFAAALVEIKHPDLMELLGRLADRAAKAGMAQPGMTIIETLE